VNKLYGLYRPFEEPLSPGTLPFEQRKERAIWTLEADLLLSRLYVATLRSIASPEVSQPFHQASINPFEGIVETWEKGLALARVAQNHENIEAMNQEARL
jgi:hypothetical protein